MKKSIMQNALGKHWEQLPEALKNHYRSNEKGENFAKGKLDIDFPWFMQWPLSIMRLLGGLPNQRGNDLLTSVSKSMHNDQQHWSRKIQLRNGKQIIFNSIFVADGDGFIEYVNRFLGIKMVAFVDHGELHYESRGYVLKLGKLKIPIPEILALGHASIIEDEFQ
jgi:hypothetical protein